MLCAVCIAAEVEDEFLKLLIGIVRDIAEK